MEDETLIVSFYACDDTAFTPLHDRYFSQMVAFFRRWVSLQNAEDVAADVLLRVIRTKHTGSGRFDPQHGTSFRNWLFTIARNGLRDHLQREGRQAQVGLEAEETLAAPVLEVPWAEPDTILAEAGELFAGPVGECLAELTENLRIVLLLDLVGQTLAEISESLGISYNAAATRLNRARAQMRACLHHRGFQFAPRNSDLPPGARVVMTFPEQVLLQMGTPHQEG